MNSDQGMTVEQALEVFQRRLDACSEPECIFCRDERPALATLRAEIARLEKDAGRYRWLRLRYDGESECSLNRTPDPYWGPKEGDALDAAIDAAKGDSHEP